MAESHYFHSCPRTIFLLKPLFSRNPSETTQMENVFSLKKNKNKNTHTKQTSVEYLGGFTIFFSQVPGNGFLWRPQL